jgi:hypothetical protein
LKNVGVYLLAARYLTYRDNMSSDSEYRVPGRELETCDLVVDAVYEGGRAGNAGDDPLPRLVGVSNQGGFRYLGSREAPRLVVITSSFAEPDWPDQLDRETGLLVYYGDNRQPGELLHNTPRFGNQLLRDMFNAVHSDPPRRHVVAPVFVFGTTGSFRDMRFLGLAVPGAPQLSSMEDLVAVWKISGGRRFQNYRAALTILDASRIDRSWIRELQSGKNASRNCPAAWSEWVETGVYTPLRAERTLEYRTRDEQLPADGEATRVLEAVRDHFSTRPVLFEACAARLVQMMDRNFLSVDLTRPSRDGGRDAIGHYQLGPGPSGIQVEFALEAKCYAAANSVGVRELSRLISRLRHRQFGVLVTTSYLNRQAYREVREDGHPVIVVSGRDIVAILARAGMTTLVSTRRWLEIAFPSAQSSSSLRED